VRAESLGRRWARRTLTIPLFLTLWFGVSIGMPLWFTFAALFDLLRANIRRAPLVRAVLFFFVYLSCEVAGMFGAFCAWAFTLGGMLVSARRWQSINLALQRGFTNMLFRGATTVFSMRCEVEGAELAATGPYILLLRHSSTADTVLVAGLLTNAYKIALRYVLKRELLWDPCLDIVGQRLRNAFVLRDGIDSEGSLTLVRSLTQHLGAEDGVLIYPEGTRFDEKKLARIQARSEAGHSAHVFTHVMPPKLGGALVLLESEVDVLFVDHVGLEGAASFADFFSGGLIGKTVRVRVRRFSSAAVPRKDRDAWLVAQWQETDRWVGAHASG
jgi:1-acyl-sn-glycerol-3-phosphate acyltransferase